MSRFKGIYWRQFIVTVGMVALTLVLLGTSFFALTYSYILSEKRQDLEDKANIIYQMAEDIYRQPSPYLGLWGSELREMVDVAQRMSNVTFLIWVPSANGFISTDTSVGGLELTIPAAMNEKLQTGGTFAGTSDLGIYEKARFVVAVPARDNAAVGPVLAVADSSSMMGMWHAFLGIFGMTAITVLLIAFVATAGTAVQQVKPIRDMAAAARRFAEGNFDARIYDTGREDEIGELTEAFNAMADSLQRTEQQRREFIANISHELKTPMTTIAGGRPSGPRQRGDPLAHGGCLRGGRHPPPPRLRRPLEPQ